MSENNKLDIGFEEKQQLRQKPYRETSIVEISGTGKYRIVGTITHVEEDSFIIQDGTGEIKVYMETPSTEISEGDQIRILGYVEFEPERKINARIIQHLKGISLEQYNKVKELEKSIRRSPK